MRVVIKEPGKPPHITEIGERLEELQAVVGGYIEVVTSMPLFDVVVYGNEEARIMSPPLPYNFTKIDGTTILGTVVAVQGNDEGEEVSMSEETAMHVAMVLGAFTDRLGAS